METNGRCLVHNNETIVKRINDILSTNEFELSISFLQTIHHFLFDGAIIPAGEFRTHNLSKKEETLKIIEGRS